MITDTFKKGEKLQKRVILCIFSVTSPCPPYPNDDKHNYTTNDKLVLLRTHDPQLF